MRSALASVNCRTGSIASESEIVVESKTQVNMPLHMECGDAIPSERKQHEVPTTKLMRQNLELNHTLKICFVLLCLGPWMNYLRKKINRS